MSDEFRIEDIPLDDPDTYKLLAEGKSYGIFQLESYLGRHWVKEMKPTSIEDISALISLIRPGCLRSYSTDFEGRDINTEDGLVAAAIHAQIIKHNENGYYFEKHNYSNIDELFEDDKRKDKIIKKITAFYTRNMTQRYCDRKNGREKTRYFHPSLETILNETYGILCYQEQILLISKEIAGFTLEESDLLRKCVAEGCLVQCKDGDFPIESLCGVTDKEILTFDFPDYIDEDPWHEPELTLVYKKLKKVWSSGEQCVYEIVLKNGQFIFITGQHQVYTIDGWKKCKELTLNDYVLCDNLYYSMIESIKYAGRINTYDFEVDDNNHWGFINGICAHNSIGKKLPELMAELKNRFVDGCLKVGKVNQKEAEEIFGWIKESQRYSFNKCLTLDSIIETKECYKTLEELEIGEYIKTWDNEFSCVVNKYNNGVQEVFEVTTTTGKITRCTLEHEFLCEDRIKRPLFEIISKNLTILCDDGVY